MFQKKNEDPDKTPNTSNRIIDVSNIDEYKLNVPTTNTKPESSIQYGNIQIR